MKELQMLNYWIKECVDMWQWQNHYDLHIDEVYGKMPRDIWIKEGLKLLRLANGIIDKRSFIVVLTVPLKGISTKNENIKTIESLHSLRSIDLSVTPPSLFIYDKNWEPLKKTLSDQRKILENDEYKVFLSKSIEDGLLYRFIDVLPIF